MARREGPILSERAAPSGAEPSGAAPSGAEPPVALYVHTPFCVSRCPYCDFVVYAGAAARGPRSRRAAYLAALETEIRLRADAVDERFGPPASPGRPTLTSLYLGGGTPSLLGGDAIAGILGIVGERFGLAPGAEVTLEVNPAPAERGSANRWQMVGVNRLSIGAQSMVDAEIRTLGRRHVAADVAATVAEAREAGIGSLSIDLLYDVPGQTLDSWAGSLEGALTLRPDHLSLYALTLDDPDEERLTGDLGDHLPTTTGARRWRERARQSQDEDRAAAMYEMACARLAGDRWHGYEISNWARPGHESCHNLAYWERRPYEAVGPGAHAFDGVVRRWNAADLDAYIAALAPGDATAPRFPPGGQESIDPRTAEHERLILGLRLARGIPRAWVDAAPFRATAPWALESGLLEIAADRLRLTTRGRLLSNELFARLV
ncbi:MAG TPA: coproporphyrinogen-III oxidase family protein [Candidatus Limnocylindrales bacterium]|nr:coproporphyrinogen-III oxidase family protein [Candidatus Limnocylindrales bacterium]